MASNDGVGGYDADFASAPPAEYFCGLCTRVLRDPTELACGHMLCRSCAAQPALAARVAAAAGAAPAPAPVPDADADADDDAPAATCPRCDEPYDASALPPSSQQMGRLVANLVVECRDGACGWSGPLRLKDDHDCPGERRARVRWVRWR